MSDPCCLGSPCSDQPANESHSEGLIASLSKDTECDSFGWRSEQPKNRMTSARQCLLSEDPDCQWDDTRKRELNGEVEAVMSVAPGELKKNGSFKLAEMCVQPVIEDPIAGSVDQLYTGSIQK